jgi:hypothetical protein
MRAEVALSGLEAPVLFSLYVNAVPTPSRRAEPARYTDDTVLVALSRSLSHLVVYVEAFLDGLSSATGLKNCYQHLEDKETQPNTQINAVSIKANTVGENSSLSCGDP